MPEVPYAKAAINGELMPKDVTNEADKLCYLGLSWLSELYKANVITKEAATDRKREILYELEQAKRMDAMWARVMKIAHDLRRDTEAALTAYRKQRVTFLEEPTPEHMRELVRLVDKIDRAARSGMYTEQDADLEAQHE